MPTEVIMPQMGESIFEGTITKWLKKTGDPVQKDEPLFEISTDKVDAEIPSPVAGVLSEIKVLEGATVEVNTVVAVITESGEAQGPDTNATPAPRQAPPEAVSAPPQVAEVVMPQMGESIFEGTITRWLKKTGDPVQKDEPLFEISTDKVDAEIPSPVTGVLLEIKAAEGETVEINTVVAVIGAPGSAPSAPAAAPVAAKPPAPATAPTAVLVPATQANAGGKIRSSPLVRRIAKDNNLDLSRIAGTGSEGRITKEDILRPLSQQGPGSAAISSPAAPPPAATPLTGDLVPLSKMRAIIAQRMVESLVISPHVHSVFKVDMTRIARQREREKAAFEQRHGVKLTYMPFIAAAVIDALRKFPIVNASLENCSIRYHDHIHLGIHFVGGDFEERLIFLDNVAGFLEPFGNGALKDRLAHLGHDYVGWHQSLFPRFRSALHAPGSCRIINRCKRGGGWRSSGADRRVPGEAEALDLRRNLEGGVFRGKNGRVKIGGCDGGLCLGAKSLEAFHSQNMLVENQAELTRGSVSQGFKAGQLGGFAARDFIFQAGHRTVGDAAGIDEGEVAQVGGHVEGESVGGDAAGDVDAYCTDLPPSRSGAWRFGGDWCRTLRLICRRLRRGKAAPDAGKAADASGLQAEFGAQADEGFFHEAHEVHRAEPTAVGVAQAAQVKDGVADKLAGSMIGDVAATVDLVQGDAAAGQELVGSQDICPVGVAAQGEDRRMLEQQQHVFNAALEAEIDELGLETEAFSVVHAAEVEVLDHGIFDCSYFALCELAERACRAPFSVLDALLEQAPKR